MAHGSPDYSNVVKPQFTHRVDDLGELVARLNKSQSIERRGEVLFYEDWEYGLTNWESFTSGTNAEFSLFSEKYVSKGFSAKLVGGSGANDLSSISYYHPYLNISKFGLEFRVLADYSVKDYVLAINYFDGSEIKLAEFLFITDSNALQIYNGSEGIVTVDTLLSKPNPTYTFSFIKLVGDFDNKKYLRLLYNERSYNLNEYSLFNNNDNSAPGIRITIASKSKTGLLGAIYLDNIILTRNE